MAFELVYTSAPSGIKTGATGFCVVACTRGMGPRLMTVLEGLSAYKPVFPHYDKNAWENPVSCAHYVSEINGSVTHILARTCFNGMDHTQRSNKLASYLALSVPETQTAAGGPGSLFMQPDMFKDASWEIVPELFPSAKTIPPTHADGGKCILWESLTGDAGWAGTLVDHYVRNPKQPAYIIFDPLQHKNMIELLNEALVLLPQEYRWQVTFNSYFVTLPAGMSCTWRCCTPDAECLISARRTPGTLIIDLTKPMGPAPYSDYADFARTGISHEASDESIRLESSDQVQEVEENVLKLQEPGLRKLPLQLSLPQHSGDEDYYQPSHYKRRKKKKQAQKENLAGMIKMIGGIILMIAVITVVLIIILSNKDDKKQKTRRWGDSISLKSEEPDENGTSRSEKDPENDSAKKQSSNGVSPDPQAESQPDPVEKSSEGYTSDPAKRQEDEAKKRAVEKKRQEDEAKKRAAEKKRQEDEAKKRAAEKKRQEDEAKRQAMVEKHRKEAEAKEKELLKNYKNQLHEAAEDFNEIKKKQTSLVEKLQALDQLNIRIAGIKIHDQYKQLKMQQNALNGKVKKEFDRLKKEAIDYSWIEGERLISRGKIATFYLGESVKMDDIKFLRYYSPGKIFPFSMPARISGRKYINARIHKGILTLERISELEPDENMPYYSFVYQGDTYYLYFNGRTSKIPKPEKMVLRWEHRKSHVTIKFDKWDGGRDFKEMKLKKYSLNRPECKIKDDKQINAMWEDVKKLNNDLQTFKKLKAKYGEKIIIKMHEDLLLKELKIKKLHENNDLADYWAQVSAKDPKTKKAPDLKKFELLNPEKMSEALKVCTLTFKEINTIEAIKKDTALMLKGYDDVRFNEFEVVNDEKKDAIQRRWHEYLLNCLKTQKMMIYIQEEPENIILDLKDIKFELKGPEK